MSNLACFNHNFLPNMTPVIPAFWQQGFISNQNYRDSLTPTNCFKDRLDAWNVLQNKQHLECTLQEGSFHPTARLTIRNNFRPLTALFFFKTNSFKPTLLDSLLEHGAAKFINERESNLNLQTPLESLFFMRSTDKADKIAMKKQLLDNGAQNTDDSIAFEKWDK